MAMVNVVTIAAYRRIYWLRLMGSLSLSLSFPVRGAGHRPNPFQEVPEASWVRVELSSRPDVPSGLLMC